MGTDGNNNIKGIVTKSWIFYSLMKVKTSTFHAIRYNSFFYILLFIIEKKYEQ